MAFALLGDIRIGGEVWTGPTSLEDKRSAALVEHAVARGKPVIQDMGDDNDTRSMRFHFDETFCDPESELARLSAAFAARSPLAYVGGDGAFSGQRFIVKSMAFETLRTTPSGRAVRIAVQLELIEAGGAGLAGLLSALARAGATALRRRSSAGVGERQ